MSLVALRHARSHRGTPRRFCQSSRASFAFARSRASGARRSGAIQISPGPPATSPTCRRSREIARQHGAPFSRSVSPLACARSITLRPRPPNGSRPADLRSRRGSAALRSPGGRSPATNRHHGRPLRSELALKAWKGLEAGLAGGGVDTSNPRGGERPQSSPARRLSLASTRARFRNRALLGVGDVRRVAMCPQSHPRRRFIAPGPNRRRGVARHRRRGVPAFSSEVRTIS